MVHRQHKSTSERKKGGLSYRNTRTAEEHNKYKIVRNRINEAIKNQKRNTGRNSSRKWNTICMNRRGYGMY